MVQETRSAAENSKSDISHEEIESLEMLLTDTESELKIIRTAR